MATDEKSPEPWPGGLHVQSPPYPTHFSPLDASPKTQSSHRLLILVGGAVLALLVAVLGVLVAAYLGGTACWNRGSSDSLPSQLTVQNEASLLLALTREDHSPGPGITCDLRNHYMLYHGQPEGCVARRINPSDRPAPCKELEFFFLAVLKNATLGAGAPGMSVIDAATLGSLALLLCHQQPIFWLHPSTASRSFHDATMLPSAGEG
ncbi:uncharacterized protein LOC120537707 [Polypterus senegalus]|uniref:uncharacterized protein LOC120537707 n=1 Tax=Polypterus senegalus TaxID=55291 RepID=UPI0019650337|nr:uncharacterized protein LOC120537707 [Polypterus senegalus]